MKVKHLLIQIFETSRSKNITEYLSALLVYNSLIIALQELGIDQFDSYFSMGPEFRNTVLDIPQDKISNGHVVHGATINSKVTKLLMVQKDQ
mmetsp:Transcript_42294/g.64855  ORF Transcript_42294/g.64855 Transcript_42294/m.64855 type:complete len:92 (+) Transcript_42294:671-946(+)